MGAGAVLFVLIRWGVREEEVLMAEVAKVGGEETAPKRRRRSQRRVTLNRRRREDLALLWRTCGTGIDHYQVLTGLSRSAAKTRLREMAKDRLLAIAGIEPRRERAGDSGMPRHFYYPNPPIGVRTGASENGIRYAKKASTIWSDRANLPQHAEHTATRLDLFCLLSLAAQATNARAGGEVISVPAELLLGETHPEAPLIGRTRKVLDRAGEEVARRQGQKKVYDAVYPDGSFTISWDSLAKGAYAADSVTTYWRGEEGGKMELSAWVEIERSAKPDYAEICKKINGYASHWLRLQKALPGDAGPLAFASFRPLLVFVPTIELAVRTRDQVRRRLASADPFLVRYREFSQLLHDRRRKVDPDRVYRPGETVVYRGGATLERFVLFGSLDKLSWAGEIPRGEEELAAWEEARRKAGKKRPFGEDAFVPLGDYPYDLSPVRERVGLSAVAEELRRVRAGASEVRETFEPGSN